MLPEESLGRIKARHRELWSPRDAGDESGRVAGFNPLSTRERCAQAAIHCGKAVVESPALWGRRFIGQQLWVGDINGDSIDGKRELPEGFIVTITPQ